MPEYLKNFDIELTGLDVGLDLKFKAEENVKAFWLKQLGGCQRHSLPVEHRRGPACYEETCVQV